MTTNEEEVMRRRDQVNAVKKLAKNNPSGRGVLLPGLWAARISMSLTQRDLASMVGTRQNDIHELERLARGAYPKTVKKLCVTLEVEPVDLMCEDTMDKTNVGDGYE